MWELFRKKITGICFTGGVDSSFFRFFTVARMSMMALLHTLILLGLIIITYLSLW